MEPTLKWRSANQAHSHLSCSGSCTAHQTHVHIHHDHIYLRAASPKFLLLTDSESPPKYLDTVSKQACLCSSGGQQHTATGIKPHAGDIVIPLFMPLKETG
ncbi:hypothetical protein NQZ68_013997 [Dissostichus eleginoides]|nr:hypothetical protein NQZ68_013997 [Dissostichus eleginoides]